MKTLRKKKPSIFPQNAIDRPAHLLLVKLCYQYNALQMRKRAGVRLSKVDGARHAALDRLLGNDPDDARRLHRRMPVDLNVRLYTPFGRARARLRNLSAGGMLVLTDASVPTGTHVKVSVGSRGGVGYTFRCTVIRESRAEGGNERMTAFALGFGEIPLAERHEPYLPWKAEQDQAAA